MIPDGDIPSSLEEFSKFDVHFEQLKDDSPQSCPVDMDSIVTYLQLEIPAEELTAEDLVFERTAQLGTKKFWVWRLDDDPLAEQTYVTVEQEPSGTTCTGFVENTADLTLDQLLLAVFHGVFY